MGRIWRKVRRAKRRMCDNWRWNKWSVLRHPSTKESKSTASEADPSSGNVHDEKIYSWRAYWYNCQVSTKSHRKYPGMVNMAMVYGKCWLSLIRQEAENMSNITTCPALQPQQWTLENLRYSPHFVDWIIQAWMEVGSTRRLILDTCSLGNL